MPDPLTGPDRLFGRTLVIATGHDLSLALLEDGELLASTHVPMLKGHAEALVPAIAELLAPFGGPGARCDRIVVETGPGSFTGLRIGLAAARALAIAWGAELSGIRSTQMVAAEARRSGLVGSLLVALAAPRGQLWVEGFGGPEGDDHPPEALTPEQGRALAGRFDYVAGTANDMPRAVFPATPPHASVLAGLAMADLGEAGILYVRAPDA